MAGKKAMEGQGEKEMNWIVLGVLVLAALVFLRYMMVPVKPKYCAVVDIWGKRWKVVEEGPHFRMPLLETFVEYSRELQLFPARANAKSKDLLEVIMEGSVEFVIDRDKEMTMRYDEVQKELSPALVNSIKSELGIVAGTKEAEEFVSQREAMELIINCRLRLKEMPHTKPEKFGDKREKITLESKLDFYTKHADEVRDILNNESGNPAERSDIEEAYGIDIKRFDLADLDYSPKTRAAFEERKQAEAKEKAAGAELELAKKFEGCSQKGINAAQVSVGKAERKVHSIEGKPFDINLGGGK